MRYIQVFENLIGPVVNSFKYLTNLSFDVLIFCICDSLSDPSRDRTKTDGTLHLDLADGSGHLLRDGLQEVQH